jgi:hypothetical protein
MPTRFSARNDRVFFALLAALCLAAAALMLEFTRSGVGVRGDSVRYVMGARNLLSGDGFSRTSGGGEVFAETGFAPLLGFVLAGLGAFGADLMEAPRILNILLLAANLVLLGTLIRGYTRSTTAAILGCTLVLTSAAVLEWHAWLMSEPLFVFLTLGSLASLVHFVDSTRPAFLILAGVLAGLCALARYVGVALVPGAALVLWFMGKGDRRSRLRNILVFGVLAVAPLSLWMLRNQAVGGQGLANRQILLHGMRPEVLRQYLFEAASWFLPESVVVPRVVRGLAAVVVGSLGPLAFLTDRAPAWIRPSAAERPAGALPWLCLLYVPAYVGVLVVNSLFLDAGTTISAVGRYMMPLYFVAVLLLLTSYADLLRRTAGRRWAMAVAVAVVSGICLLQTVPSYDLVRRSTAAFGFTRVRSHWPDLPAQLSNLAGEQPIISNNPEMVYYLLERPAYTMPILFDVYQQAEREDFDEQVELAARRLEAGSVLILFGPPRPLETEVLSFLPIQRLATFPETVVYGGR